MSQKKPSKADSAPNITSLLHLAYDGYDPTWILGKDKGPPVVPKPKPPPPPAPKPAQPAKPAEPEPIVLKADFCCGGCVQRMTYAFKELEGLESVKLDQDSRTITIKGKVNAEQCLSRARKVYKRTELLPTK